MSEFDMMQDEIKDLGAALDNANEIVAAQDRQLAAAQAENAKLRKALKGMVERVRSCGSELPWDRRGGPDPLVEAVDVLGEK